MSEINNLTTIKFRATRFHGSEYEPNFVYGVFTLNPDGVPVAVIDNQQFDAAGLAEKVGAPFCEIQIVFPHPDPDKRFTRMSQAEIWRWEKRLTDAGFRF